MYGVKVSLGSILMNVVFVQQYTKDRKEWRAVVSVLLIGFHMALFAWFLCSFGLHSRALVAY